MSRTFVRWAFLLVLVALGVQIVLLALADAVSRSRPGIALMLDGGNVRALTARAAAALSRPDASVEEARIAALAAIRAEVFAPGAYRTLARIAELEKDETAAARIWPLAARSARDGEAQAAALVRALNAGANEDAIARLDVLLRGQHPARWGTIVRAVLPLLAGPPLAAALADTLSGDPPWRRAAYAQMAEHADQDLLSRVTESLAAGPGLRPEELRAYLRRLVRTGRHIEAYVAFLRSLPGERLARMGYLYNARFQYGVGNMPFDWEITPAPGVLAEVVREQEDFVLSVSFFGGRSPFRNVNHHLFLPPGDFSFTGVEKAESLRNPRGLRWSIVCAGADAAVLGQTELLAGNAPWRPFRLDFTVPQNCPVQNLVLELPARVALEREASGRAAFAKMSIQQP